MIVVKLWGGLGNQLFQYAYAYSLAERLNQELSLDIDFFGTQSLRSVKILDFNIKHKDIVKREDLPKTIKLLNGKNLNRLIRIPPFFDFTMKGKMHYLKETRFKYDHRIDNFESFDVYLDGYWQSPKYFERNRKELLGQYKVDDLSYSYKRMYNQLVSENSVAIHIRRGDYTGLWVKMNGLKPLSSAYYESCINGVIEKVPSPKFYLFTDDVEWVRKNFIPLEHQYFISDYAPFTDVEELLLMSACRYQIIANSTFSWWGAWMNEYESKIVWAPGRSNFPNKDMIPSDWITIDV